MEFINLKKQYQVLKPTIDADVQAIMTDAHFIGGKEVSIFEEKLAKYVGRKHCISCGNGTDALMLAYLAYGVGGGDAVFCPDMTFIASIEPACMLGATPVFVDIDPVSYNIDPAKLEEAIVRIQKEGKYKPKVVVAVDFLGNPADMDSISEICRKYSLVLIEDAAQGTGAMYKGRMCGSMGDIACTSFFPSKPLGCYGDGGAVFTDSDEIADLVKSLKVHGKGSSKYDNIRIGVNSRLDTIQAAVLLAKMTILEEEMAKRQKIAARYDEGLKDVIQVPVIAEGCRCAYAQYVLIAEDAGQRKMLLSALQAANIPTLLYYPKEMHRMDAFHLGDVGGFENTTRYANCNFGIPFSPYVTEEEQELVISTIRNVLK